MTMRIVQLTDLHLTAKPGQRVFGSDVWQNLSLVLGHVARELPALDRLVLTGDLANAGRLPAYERLRDLLQPWAGRLSLLPGNHDDRELLRQVFHEQWSSRAPRLTFSQPLGPCHLLGLDSLHRGRTLGRLDAAQLAWLGTELAAIDRPIVLFLHHPPVRVGCWWLDKDLLRDRGPLESALRGRTVAAIFAGHVHQEHAAVFGGIALQTTPAVAYQYRPGSWLPLPVSRRPALRVIEIAAGAVTSRVVRL